MTVIDAIILGIIQGASEYIPISSSAHLVIGQSLLKVNEPSIFLEVSLHLGTLLAVIIYYRRDILKLLSGFFMYFNLVTLAPVVNPILKLTTGSSIHLTPADETKYRVSYRMCLFIILGTIPAGVGGLLFKDWFETRFDSVSFSGYMLLITGAILLSTRFAANKNRPINALNALVIGVSQFCAILPGISRSGSTISTGLFLGVTPKEAARFSFLLSIPSVAGAVLLKYLEMRHTQFSTAEIDDFAIGAAVSFVVGLVAIHYLLKLLAGRKFYLFGFYCLLIGIFTIFYF